MAKWLGHCTCKPEVPGSSPPPCHLMDLSSVAPNSTPACFVNSQLFTYDICFLIYSVPKC